MTNQTPQPVVSQNAVNQAAAQQAAPQKTAAAPKVQVQNPAPAAVKASTVQQTKPQTQVQATPQQAASAQTAQKPAAQTQQAPASNNNDQLLKQKLAQLQNAILAANIPQMVMSVISYALDLRSSDIHIESLENRVRVRFRIDGVLRQIVEYPNNLHPAVVSRVKIMANLKIDEQRLPQDGRADVTTKDGKAMDLRVSTLPTVNGEKIVMRIQDKSRKIPDLKDLGITGSALKNLHSALKSPNGIIINTGPTGSGKTTTLYACLTMLNNNEVNILTIEDPVEIQLDGLNQSQVHHDINFDFAAGMRSALRQDPDIIMVGEIRDKETANTAIEAALTGHLVFSTLHTNSAVESLIRLINMGIAPYLLTSTIELIIAQRLVRKLCSACKKPVKPSEDMLSVVTNAMSKVAGEDQVDPEKIKQTTFYEPVGCENCNKVGYQGRVGLYEVLKMSNKLRELILKGGSSLEILEAAQESGLVTLEQAGIIKAIEGATSLSEVYRVARKSE
jgi:type II secretory ATPase GspE/PulE/Tfp pilus assembly ATPase PilB-like protein